MQGVADGGSNYDHTEFIQLLECLHYALAAGIAFDLMLLVRCPQCGASCKELYDVKLQDAGADRY
jgi:hypothetical protein